MRFIEWFKSRGLQIIIYAITALVLANLLLIFYLRSVEGDQHHAYFIKSRLSPFIQEIKKSAANIDFLSLKAVISPDPNAIKSYSQSLQSLSLNVDSLKYNALKYEVSSASVNSLEGTVSTILSSHQNFLFALKRNDESKMMTGLSQLLPATSGIETSLKNFEAELNSEFNSLTKSVHEILPFLGYIQFGLLAGIPFLFLTALSLIRYKRRLVKFNREIHESNQRYVFDSKEPIDITNTDEVKAALLSNLKRAADFIKSVSSGNYGVTWEGMTEDNRDANTENIAGELIQMREQMKRVKEEDEARIWANEGLSMFGEIIRKNQDDFEILADSLITNVVKYVKAKVGGLFIIEHDEETNSEHLGLKACFAYDRKKYIDKKLTIGEGLVGQTYLEGQTVYLKEVPDEYMTITSGLGETNPRSLLVVPLRANDRIEGVLELASLNDFKPHEIEFLEKLGETLASSVVSVRNSEKTKELLAVSQEQSEEMRAQEEEMRQNMEELEATQEQMTRQVDELNQLKESLETEKYFFNALMENLPYSIYFKDRDSKLLRVSNYMVKHFNIPMKDLIGKSDFDFQDHEHAQEAYDDEQNIMRTDRGKINFIEKETRDDGSVSYVSTTKMPLKNLQGQTVGTFGLSSDITHVKQLEIDMIAKENELLKEQGIHRKQIEDLERQVKEKEALIEGLRNKK